jgi:hypothetical protein
MQRVGSSASSGRGRFPDYAVDTISANSRLSRSIKSRRRRMIEADHQILVDEAVGMIVVVKRRDFLNR